MGRKPSKIPLNIPQNSRPEWIGRNNLSSLTATKCSSPKVESQGTPPRKPRRRPSAKPRDHAGGNDPIRSLKTLPDWGPPQTNGFWFWDRVGHPDSNLFKPLSQENEWDLCAASPPRSLSALCSNFRPGVTDVYPKKCPRKCEKNASKLSSEKGGWLDPQEGPALPHGRGIYLEASGRAGFGEHSQLIPLRTKAGSQKKSYPKPALNLAGAFGEGPKWKLGASEAYTNLLFLGALIGAIGQEGMSNTQEKASQAATGIATKAPCVVEVFTNRWIVFAHVGTSPNGAVWRYFALGFQLSL